MNHDFPTEQFDSALDNLKDELAQIRTGRATPALVENISVDYYGAKTPLQQLASITVPDPKSVLIQPWDVNSVKDIEKAIQLSSLGLHPVNEGKVIRVVIPQLTQERREELVRLIGKKSEDSRVRLRNIREDILKDLQQKKKDGLLPEDDFFRLQKDLQKTIDTYGDMVKDIVKKKEVEILTV